ncbi:MarR family winged helix-turn-helix transcriptional regulator [Rhodopseudomonas palustris]|uniref:MarR family winged helix-turn-helix transcriptional regulator n=1 Tax=Rhodopseudomonas palustris TaxID=1076 RepID=UPI000164AC78|nr:MarR family winged helix-turn-helix transcriptional regulator [Rhodopseudomonas palustris]ACE99099.1 transcriptional regulator, MarR family [Rhodopseudomonas palustris TIE-1]WBU30425.1 MarR family winged helix-turn-helix transcriptional regulator [Rhodopseudomonas palustris]
MQTKSKADARAPRGSTIDPDLARRFATTVASVTVFLDEIRQFRAKSLGISGPQFALLMAVMDLEQGDGVSIRHVAKAVHVDPSFITTQSKLLEKKGLVRRQVDSHDARVVKLSLSDKAYKQIAALATDERDLNSFIFEDISGEALEQLTSQLGDLQNRLEKATVKLASGL